jgi:low temperature requirement protein LtrA
MTSYEQVQAHRLRVMSGRDPNERHRAATPLELLYDLTFVVALEWPGSSLRTCSPKAILPPASRPLAWQIFAICWAWINFSWFASAYE